MISDLAANDWKLPEQPNNQIKPQKVYTKAEQEEIKRRELAALWADYWATHDDEDQTLNERLVESVGESQTHTLNRPPN